MGCFSQTRHETHILVIIHLQFHKHLSEFCAVYFCDRVDTSDWSPSLVPGAAAAVTPLRLSLSTPRVFKNGVVASVPGRFRTFRLSCAHTRKRHR